MKCSHCKKKIGYIEYDCKCLKKFCPKCRHPEQHNCTYDYKTEQKLKLTKSLLKVVPEKIIRIK